MKQFALTSYVLYFLGGLVLTVTGAVLPQLLDYYNLSYTRGGQLVFLGSLGFLIGVPTSTLLLGRLSEKNLLALATAIIATAQVGIFSLPSFQFILLFSFLNGVGVAALEVIIATVMMELFIGRRAVVMSYLEVSFGIGALLMPLVASFFINYYNWRYSFLFTSILAIVLIVICKAIHFNRRDSLKEDTKPLDASPSSSKLLDKHARWKVLGLSIVMIFMCAGIESSLNNFLPSIFITYLNALPSYASLSIGVFWVAMLIGRIATGWVIRKITYERYLLFGISGTIISLILFILLKNIFLGYLLLLLLGLSMSGLYSITMVYANHKVDGQNRLVTSLITGFSGLGGAISPAIIGFSMDQVGTRLALYYIVGFGFIYLVALFIIFFIKDKVNYSIAEEM